jgi:N-acetylglutamate synthase-like GNAT family acetyltransferase
MAELTIRQANQQDGMILKEIIDLSFPRFFRFFASHSVFSEEGKVIVNEIDGAIAGFAKLIEFKVANVKYGCILWLAVHPNQRRKGIGSQLVKAGTIKLEFEGAQQVFASVQRTNKASLATFHKEYKRIGICDLWRLFGWRTYQVYLDIWFAPGEIVLINE